MCMTNAAEFKIRNVMYEGKFWKKLANLVNHEHHIPSPIFTDTPKMYFVYMH